MTTLRFHDFELDLAAYQLRRGGRAVRLERRPMEALMLLAARPGELVTREELIEALWGGKVVIDFDTGLNTVIRKIRQALEDPAEQPRVLETVTGKGYRFIASLGPGEAAPAPAPRGPGWRMRGWLAAAASLALVMLLAVALQMRPGTGTGKVRIAVLPFDTLAGTPQLEYLGNGLAEDTIGSLGRISPAQLEVIGPASTLEYKRGGRPLTAIGRDLRADYAVVGSLRAEGSRLRVTIALIRASDQVQLWTASFDRELTSTLGLQRELSAAIARQVQLRITPEQNASLAQRHTMNPKAYDLYLRGLNEWRRASADGNRAALQFFEAAIVEDPRYALAWAGVAQTLGAAPMNGDARRDDVVQWSRHAVDEAVTLAPGLPETQIASAYQEFWLEWHWKSAAEGMQRAIDLDPNNAFANLFLGHILSQLGQHEKAQALARRARELDPLSPMTYALSSQIAFQARDFEAARDFALQAIAIDANFWIGHMQLAQALERQRQYPQAMRAIELASRYSGGNSKPRALGAYLLARMGRGDEALAILAELEHTRGSYVPPYALALINAGLGREAEVRRWLEQAAEDRDVHLGFLPVDPKWDEFGKRPWFAALLEKCGFARSM